jgi:uncharacterized membrane protein
MYVYLMILQMVEPAEAEQHCYYHEAGGCRAHQILKERKAGGVIGEALQPARPQVWFPVLMVV